MKKASRCLSVLLLVLFMTTLLPQVSAMNSGFSTQPLTDRETNLFISNVGLSLLTEEPSRKPIECFDVNTDQEIAIGQSDSNKKIVCVYSNNGVFQYGYKFNCSGRFGIEWDKQNLNIYFFRSDVIMSVSPDGAVLDIRNVENTLNNNDYRNAFFHTTQRTVADKTFVIRNDMGILNYLASSYSQLVTSDSTGETILYDVGSTQLVRHLAGLVGSLIAVFLAAIIIKRRFIS